MTILKSLLPGFCLVAAAWSAAAETVADKLDAPLGTDRWQLSIPAENNAIWEVKDGVLAATAAAGKSGMILLKDFDRENYTAEVEFKFVSGAPQNVGLIFRGAPPKARHATYFTGFIFSIAGDKGVLHAVDPVWRRVKESKLVAAPDDTWHSLKVEVKDESLKCYLDGQLIISEASGKFEKGTVGLRVASGSSVLFRNFKVVCDEK